jgi:diguanylate cyclase (GGDEF)-like protein
MPGNPATGKILVGGTTELPADPIAATIEIRVLVVDDDETALFALTSLLESSGATIVQARSGEEALAVAAENDFAAVLLDVGMPGMDGFEVARRIKAHRTSQHVPIIFLTGHIDEAEIRRGYDAGAVDYLLKPIDPSVLQAKVGTFVDLARLRHETALLTHRALHDPLTGLANRTLFFDRCEQAVTRLGRDTRLVGVLFLDLDNFKAVNDRYGHDTGDRLLIEAASRLQATIRAVDTAARFGGDEFLVLCENVAAEEDMERLQERVIEALGHTAPPISTSIGYAITADPKTPAEELVRAADHAMLRSKALAKR